MQVGNYGFSKFDTLVQVPGGTGSADMINQEIKTA